MPGSPTSIISRPRPDSESSRPARSSSISFSRPTKMPAASRSSGLTSDSAATGVVVEAVATIACSACGIAAALSGRSFGSLARRRSTIDSKARGTSGLCQDGATGAVLMCCEMIATGSSPRKGARPVTIS